MGKFDKKLAAILTKTRIITEQQRDEALAESERSNTSLTEVLVQKNFCDEATLITSVAEEMNYYPINLGKIDASPDALELLNEEQANNYQVFPVARLGKMLTLAIANP